MYRQLSAICARLEQIEQNMSRSDQVDQLKCSMETSFHHLNHLLTEIYNGIDKLKRGIESYTKAFVQNFFGGGSDDEGFVAEEMVH